MKLGEAKDKAVKLIAEYSNNGNVISTIANADYTLRMNDLVQAAQLEICKEKPIFASYQITQNPIPNQIGLLQGFDLVQHLDKDYSIAANGSKAYYFEVDREATVYIEEQTSAGVWTILSTIAVPSGTKSFTPYKGLITPSSASNMVRLRFSGTYPYSIRNTALYGFTFPSVADVPDYRPYVKYAMPADFMELKDVIYEADERQYNKYGNYYWENRKTLVLNYYMKGSFTVEYYRYPTEITSTASDDTAFELDPDACELIPYYLAAHVSMDEPQKQNMVSYYLNMYQQKMANLGGDEHAGISFIQNTSGW